MIENENQRRISELERKIRRLEKDNREKNKDIDKLEEVANESSRENDKWQCQLSDIFSAVSSRLSHVSPYSSFKDDYLSEINSIFSGREANQISDSFCTVRSKSLRKINVIEEEINANKVKIRRYEKEIDELRAKNIGG